MIRKLVFIAIALTPYLLQAEKGGQSLEWLATFPEAIKAAKETGQPIFLEFRCAP